MVACEDGIRAHAEEGAVDQGLYRERDTTVRQVLRAWTEDMKATRQPDVECNNIPCARPSVPFARPTPPPQTWVPLSDVTVAGGITRVTTNSLTQLASKRKAEHLSDDLSSNTSSPDNFDRRSGLLEQKRPRFTKLPPARRPERADAWYSHSTTAEEWAEMN